MLCSKQFHKGQKYPRVRRKHRWQNCVRVTNIFWRVKKRTILKQAKLAVQRVHVSKTCNVLIGHPLINHNTTVLDKSASKLTPEYRIFDQTPHMLCYGAWWWYTKISPNVNKSCAWKWSTHWWQARFSYQSGSDLDPSTWKLLVVACSFDVVWN